MKLQKTMVFGFAMAAMAPALASAGGPLGVWMLTDGDNNTDALIQGNTVMTFSQGPGTQQQYPIQWDAGSQQWETVGRDQGGQGGVYTINHNYLFNFYNNTSEAPPNQHLDGTLDTADGWSLASVFDSGEIVRYDDAYFNGPTTVLWSSGGAFDVWTVTYAQSNGVIYVGQNGFITEINAAGQTLGTFKTISGAVRSLAYDAIDNSLWYLTTDGMTAVQTDLAGNQLQTETVNLGGNYWGGEIAPVRNVLPEPAPMAVLGLGVLALVRRRKA